MSKHIHVIGICGVATSALAIAFHKKGYKVTGSDKGFFPPVSAALENAGVHFWAGWHPEKFEETGTPDVVIAGGGGTASSNPELQFAKEHNLPLHSFAEAIEKYFRKEKTICSVGTWGKTSSSALLSYILKHAEYNPSYMFGGLSLSHDSAELTDSDYAVFEGDEYKAAIWDERPKFALYKPTHILLTAVSWDHADLYPTEKNYFDTFEKLVKGIPEGQIVACKDNEGVQKVLSATGQNTITYGEQDADFTYTRTEESRDGITFTIAHDGNAHKIESPMLGAFQAENITGAFAMAVSIGVEPEKVVEAIKEFKGLKRRLEKRLDGNVMVIDDIAHSPEKARSICTTIRHISTGHVTVIFEPNIGGRERDAKEKYNHAFKDADTVIIPRLSQLKVKDGQEPPMDGKELAEVIAETHSDVEYIEDDDALLEHVTRATLEGDAIAFLGSHGFRGMIDTLIEKLK